MDKLNGIMNDLADMANFKGFGESKEIIIDGVDVAGCVQLIEELDYPCGLGGKCEGWENCYYKQFKRLEQENKELAHYLACMTEQRNKANTTLQEIKAIISGDYEMLDPQALQEIRSIITKAEEE